MIKKRSEVVSVSSQVHNSYCALFSRGSDTAKRLLKNISHSLVKSFSVSFLSFTALIKKKSQRANQNIRDTF